MVGIIDYDAGNIGSVEKIFKFLGAETVLTRDRDILLACDHVFLPGVGHFAKACEKIRLYNVEDTIKEIVERQIPFMGICLGMQLLFEYSEEAPGIKGLGLLPGTIRKFPEDTGLKVPHMGWNSVLPSENSRLFHGIEKGSYFYFVHSYYLETENDDIVAAKTEYGHYFNSAVEQGNIFGCQFHPEKSSYVGQRLLRNFLEVK